MSKTIMQIQEDRRKTELAIYDRMFNLAAEAKEFSQGELNKMSRDIVGTIGTEKAHAILVAEADKKAQELRADAFAEYEAGYLLYVDSLQARKADLEAALFKQAGEADPVLLLEMAGAPTETLRSLMDLALGSGNLVAGDIAFAEAHRRDDDVLITHYAAVRGAADEAWLSLYEELTIAEGVTPILDIGDHFDRIFGRPPDKSDLARELSVTNVRA
jgi:hypothetical protein